MDTSWLGTLIAQLLIAAGWLLVQATRLAARVCARHSAALLPPPASERLAVGQAAVVGALWGTALPATAALSGDGGVIVLGLVAGAVFGGLVGVATADIARARAQGQAGGVAVGVGSGVLGVRRPHVIERAARVRHLAVFGPTGSGKSTVLQNLVLQDAAAPHRPGLLVVDVKDDLVLGIAARLPAEARERVLLFDPADRAFPPAFNPLAGVPPEGRTLAAAELLAALKRLYTDAWGPRLEHVLRAVLLTLLETPQATLLDIVRLLTDAAYRGWAVGRLSNFSVRAFWEREFAAIVGGRGSLANVESLLNKLGVLSYPEVRNVLGQTRRGLDLRAALDAGQLVLAHLPQGALGEDAANFLAALLVARVQLAAQSRVALPAAHRRPFYVVADEFQNYETPAFDKLVTEGRAMGVGLVAACQFREQLPAHLRLALEHNCAYALDCRLVQGRHRLVVVKQQEPEAPDAVRLIRPLPPPRPAAAGQLAMVRAASRARLAAPRAQVEAAISRRLAGSWGQSAGMPGEATAAPAERRGASGRHESTRTMEDGDGRYFD